MKYVPDWDELSEYFAVTKRHTYLAKAAITPIPMPVYNEVSKYYNDILIHGRTSWNESAKIEQTRDLFAKFIGAYNKEEVAFTHSTSEGMNIIAHMLSDKGIVISYELEFPTITRNVRTSTDTFRQRGV
jgi:cysteine desulfurase / selenocysteine lyase